MAIPVLPTVATGALFVWCADPDVEPNDPDALGWILAGDARVGPGADVLEVAPLNGESASVVLSSQPPTCYYEAARRAVLGRRLLRDGRETWQRGAALQRWLPEVVGDPALDLYLLIRALTHGTDPQTLYRRAYGLEAVIDAGAVAE